MEKIKYYSDKELYGVHEMIDDIQRHGLLAGYEYNQALDIYIITAWTGRGCWKMMRTVSGYKPTIMPNRTSILHHNTERHIAVETIIKEYEQFIQTEKEKEMKNEQKFTRDDLKLGHIIKLRNGKYYSIQMVGKGTLIATDGERDWIYLSSAWDDRLNSICRSGRTYPAISYDETKDIVEVYGYVQGCDYYARESGYIGPNHRPLLWYRQEAKKMTVEEIEKILGYKVEIVSD